MALVTVQRSPSLGTDSCCETDGLESQEEAEGKLVDNQQRSISECYFTVKGAALVLPQNECIHVYRKISTHGGDIQQHLQSMFYLLRAEDTLKMAVKLESIHADRMRYLVVISWVGRQTMEESCLLGIDCNDEVTIGMVLPVWADTRITLDGDGGFSVSSSGRHHIFKPVSVQAMWSALQTLHRASAKAISCNYYVGGGTHAWIEYYENRIKSDRSCLNEWHAMDDLISKRPPSPGSLRSKPMEREATESFIRSKLKEIMMSVDLDEVTSKYIRGRLEEKLNMDLHEYKSFIDQEMLIILGQMDAATEIFEYLFLGSEWNASNLEELQRNGIGQILNVTREIDNFFPGMFEYLNVRVYDEDGTELLRHWDKTFKFIEKAKKEHSKVLVHCKMGVSRSASVVIAYAMKAYGWDLQAALEFVKTKRSCIKPNTGFMKQLETYQGILDASKQRHNTLWRSKSETDLKSPLDLHPSSETLMNPEPSFLHENVFLDVPGTMHRPKSWSPEDNIANLLFSKHDVVDHHLSAAQQAKVEKICCASETVVNAIVEAKNKHMLLPGRNGQSYSVSPNKVLHLTIASTADEKVMFSIGDGDDSPVYECRNPLLVEEVCDQNVLVPVNPLERVSSVKDRINELESQLGAIDGKLSKDQLNLPELRGLVLNLANQFEATSKPNTPSPIDELHDDEDMPPLFAGDANMGMEGNEPVLSQTKPPAPRHQAILVKTETWTSDAKTSKAAEEWHQNKGPLSGSIEMVKKMDDLLMKVRVSPGLPFDAISVPKNENKNIAGQPTRESGEVTSLPSTNGPALAGKKTIQVKGTLCKANPESQKGSSTSGRKEDPFSVDLDRVFDREEEFQQKNTSNSDAASSELPSRQSSWGSCDSAIVIQKHDRKESPSRQSSWGSGDSHGVNLSREESWSSSDCYRYARQPTSRLLSFGQRTLSVPDSQYSSSGLDLHPPFVCDQTSVKPAKANEETGHNNQGNLKRTNSFDGSLLVNSAATSADVDAKGDASMGSIQRSQSLRTGNRMRLPHQLPNLKLHTPTPYKSPVEKEGSALLRETTENVYFSRILHCASFPFLAQNTDKHPSCARDHCASHPNITSSPLSSDASVFSPKKLKTVVGLDFAQTCQTPTLHLTANDETAASTAVSQSGHDRDVGIVKQQKKVLEKKIASNVSPELVVEIDDTRWQENNQPVLLGSSPELDDCNLGKVKRLTKELESKSTPPTKDCSAAVKQESAKHEQLSIERSSSSPAMQVNNEASRATTALEEKSVRTLVGKFESKDRSRPRYHSENDTLFRTAASDSDPLTARSPVSPRESARKLSLEIDLSCRHDKGLAMLILPRSPSLPLGNKCISADLVHKNERNEQRSSDVSQIATSPPTTCVLKESGAGNTLRSPCPNGGSCKPASKVATSCHKSATTLLCTMEHSALPLIPQPPPLPVGSAPRKMRKLHGKTHPLNKLMVAKQRHPSTLYNTM